MTAFVVFLFGCARGATAIFCTVVSDTAKIHIFFIGVLIIISDGKTV